MKKVIISLVAVLGLASAAWAFTPSTKTDEQAGMVEQNAHNHAVELNSHEGHQHNVASCYHGKWQCSKCGKLYEGFSNHLYEDFHVGNCPSTPSRNHIWTLIKCDD